MTLQRLLGVSLPIIQAPMAGVQGSALAVAVSNAGGLGSLPCALAGPSEMRRELATIRAHTSKPFNVNFFCHRPPEFSVERESAWRAALSPHYDELGIDVGPLTPPTGREPFSNDAADLLAEFRPPIVSFPVVAAGGIGDARDVAAAMAAGAAGVQVGTAYLLCPEATTSTVHRAALNTDAARDTAITNVFTGRPARGIVNRIVRELGPMSPMAPAFPLATSAITPLRAKAESLGSADFSPLWAGQNAHRCREVPAGVLTRELMQDIERSDWTE